MAHSAHPDPGDQIRIEATASTPLVVFDRVTGTLDVTGESYPMNSFEFFGRIIEWLNAFLSDGDRPLTLNLALTYLNTGSIKSLMDILDLLDEAHRNGRPVTVNWICDEDNDRALEMAEEFGEDVTLPFNIFVRTDVG